MAQLLLELDTTTGDVSARSIAGSGAEVAYLDVAQTFTETQTIDYDGTGLILPAGGASGATTAGGVIGHTARIDEPIDTAPFQILGTSYSTAAMMLGRWSASKYAGSFAFIKSRSPVIFDDTDTILLDNDHIGTIGFFADDGEDLMTSIADFKVEVDDATPEENGIGSAFVWQQMPGGGTDPQRETMRIAADGTLKVSVGSIDLNDQGSVKKRRRIGERLVERFADGWRWRFYDFIWDWSNARPGS